MQAGQKPLSYYGQGEVSADFPGIARRKRQAKLRGVHQIYCSGCSVGELENKVLQEPKPFQQCLAAIGLSWRQRCSDRKPIQIPSIDFGQAQMLLLPGESYVEYQLEAQKVRPDSFVCVSGYGDGATGYIPTERHIAEHDPNLGDWCWVAPGAEPRMVAAMREALKPAS